MSLFDRRPFSVVLVLWVAAHGRAGARRRTGRRVLAAVPVVLLTCTGLLLALGAPTAAADSCPNAQFRTGPGADLPDCRAYEMVSPVDTGGTDVNHPAQAVAVDGNSVAWESNASFAGQPGNTGLEVAYLSTRGASGWSTLGIDPPFNNPGNLLELESYTGWSTDLRHMVLEQQIPGEPENTLLRNPDGSFTVLNPGMPNDTSVGGLPMFAGASSDFSHVLLNTPAVLTSNAPSDVQDKLYESQGGALSLVSVLPDGTPSNGQAGGGNAISADGSRVFWSPSQAISPVYLAQAGSSTAISSSQCTTGQTGGAGPGGNCAPDGASENGRFVTAAGDGSVALFTASQELTNDATTGSNGGGTDLYSYGVATGKLTDLSPDSNSSDTFGARVQGVVGASADASYVYFVADGALAAPASSGTCALTGSSPCNLYVWHDGAIKFIGALTRHDIGDWNVFPHPASAQVSADGTHLLFTSSSSLTGYDNAGFNEIFRYDATTGSLTCVSCNPGAAAATGNAALSGSTVDNFVVQTNMSSDGSRVFFESPDPLVAGATHGQNNVYEWEADGAGSCQSNAQNGGCLYPISTGQSASPSFFEGASPSGDDVFFATRDDLVGQDTGQNLVLYDARVDGGLAGQNPGPPPAPCSAGTCQGPAGAQPAPATAASVSFSGPGNVLSGPAPKSTPKSTAKARVLSRTVRGASFFVRVRVPGRGTITIAGAGIRTVRHAVAKAGTYRLKAALTAKERKALKRRHRLRLKLRVGFAPPGGTRAFASFSLTVVRAGGAK